MMIYGDDYGVVPLWCARQQIFLEPGDARLFCAHSPARPGGGWQHVSHVLPFSRATSLLRVLPTFKVDLYKASDCAFSLPFLSFVLLQSKGTNV